MYSLQAGKLLLFAGELMIEPQLGNLLNFIVDLTRRNANETRGNQPVQTTRKDRLREKILYLELLTCSRRQLHLVLSE